MIRLDEIINRLRTDKKLLLILIFILSVFLRVSMNYVKEEVVFNRPFLYFDSDYDKSVISDSKWYDAAARAFLAGKGVMSANKNLRSIDFPGFVETRWIDDTYYAHKSVPPGYPLFLALCYYVGGFNTLAFFIPQLILSSLTVILIYAIAELVFGRYVALIAAVAASVYPDLVFWMYKQRTETLFIFLLAIGFYYLVRSLKEQKVWMIILSSVSFGLSCLTRVTIIPFIPVIMLWLLFFFGKQKIYRLASFVLFGMIVFLCMLPWSYRNYQVFNKFTPFTDEMNVVIVQESLEKHGETMSYFEKHKSIVLRIIMFIKNNFSQFLLESITRFFYFWGPITGGMHPIAKVYKFLTWLVIFPLAFYGLYVSLPRFMEHGIIPLFIIYHALLHSASFVDGGLVYRYPIQPFLCIYFGVAIVKIFGEKYFHRAEERILEDQHA